MSNQEAIALLRNLKDVLDSYCELNEEGKTAFRMAIEALSCSENPNNSDCISRQAAIDALKRKTFQLTFAEEQKCELHIAWSADAVYSDVMEGALLELPSTQPEWNNHTVACLLADMFGDTCACNYNGIDEWLPEKCEVIDACPNPVGVACWEQFLTHRAERRTDEGNL